MEEIFKNYVDTDVKITNELLESVTKLGMKHDQEKPMMNLIPPSVFESLGKVLTYRANKYAPNSWQHVTNAEERYKAALLRHFVEYMKNPLSKDEESGMYHIEHVLCNAAFLNDFTMNKNDDILEPKEKIKVTQNIHQPEKPFAYRITNIATTIEMIDSTCIKAYSITNELDGIYVTEIRMFFKNNTKLVITLKTLKKQLADKLCCNIRGVSKRDLAIMVSDWLNNCSEDSDFLYLDSIVSIVSIPYINSNPYKNIKKKGWSRL